MNVETIRSLIRVHHHAEGDDSGYCPVGSVVLTIWDRHPDLFFVSVVVVTNEQQFCDPRPSDEIFDALKAIFPSFERGQPEMRVTSPGQSEPIPCTLHRISGQDMVHLLLMEAI